jgi:tetratricopeptide (TPR) repeat protein
VPQTADGASSFDQAVFFLHLGRARERLHAGRLEEARHELELARLTRPEDEDLLNLVSLVEFRRGDFFEAARATRTLLRKNPNSAVLHANLGVIQFRAGLFDESERELARAIELDPRHARSHLHLGLLCRRRGDLPKALEHLRRAGAKKAAAEVEEALRLGAPRPPRPETLAGGAAPIADSRPLPAAGAAPRSPERDAEDRPLFRVHPDGTLEAASRGLVYVRKGSVVWYSGRIRFAEEPAFAGTRLDRLLRAEGRGDLLLCDPQRRAVARDAAGQSLSLEGSRVLALSADLRFRLDPIHDFRTHRRVDILKVHGRGGAVFSLAGELEAHDVSADFPLSLSSRDLVAWTGDLVPSVLQDRLLNQIMLPDPANAPKLLFAGEGVVLTEGPRKNW